MQKSCRIKFVITLLCLFQFYLHQFCLVFAKYNPPRISLSDLIEDGDYDDTDYSKEWEFREIYQFYPVEEQHQPNSAAPEFSGSNLDPLTIQRYSLLPGKFNLLDYNFGGNGEFSDESANLTDYESTGLTGSELSSSFSTFSSLSSPSLSSPSLSSSTLSSSSFLSPTLSSFSSSSFFPSSSSVGSASLLTGISSSAETPSSSTSSAGASLKSTSSTAASSTAASSTGTSLTSTGVSSSTSASATGTSRILIGRSTLSAGAFPIETGKLKPILTSSRGTSSSTGTSSADISTSLIRLQTEISTSISSSIPTLPTSIEGTIISPMSGGIVGSTSGGIVSSTSGINNINSCAAKPCLNDGICSMQNNAINNYICNCTLFYRGNNCESPNPSIKIVQYFEITIPENKIDQFKSEYTNHLAKVLNITAAHIYITYVGSSSLNVSLTSGNVTEVQFLILLFPNDSFTLEEKFYDLQTKTEDKNSDFYFNDYNDYNDHNNSNSSNDHNNSNSSNDYNSFNGSNDYNDSNDYNNYNNYNIDFSAIILPTLQVCDDNVIRINCSISSSISSNSSAGDKISNSTVDTGNINFSSGSSSNITKGDNNNITESNNNINESNDNSKNKLHMILGVIFGCIGAFIVGLTLFYIYVAKRIGLLDSINRSDEGDKV